jgi:ribosomal protein S18 acetylase RimI-like enzyme
MGLDVRLLDAADVDAYRALRLAGLRAHPRAFGADADDEAGWPMSDWLARLQQRSTFGAFIDGKLVGTAALAVEIGRKSRHRGHLVGMYVAPEGRRRGVGRALVESVLATARGQVELVLLTVSVGNAAAISLYDACGFRPYAIEPDALRIDGESVDELRMQRRL